MPAIATIRITGADAATFLQGQLTNDVRRLETESEILAAWCNPKGRVICFGSLRRINDGYEYRIAADIADDVLRRLTMFRFRSKVDLAVDDATETADAASLIESGRAFVGRDQSEKFTPHMLNLDLIDAISLTKGCYTGQEVVARTHYKGATKRRALRFSAEAPVAPGDKVSCDGRDVGEVLNVAGNDLLAVVPTDKADEALTVNGMRLERRPLPYAATETKGGQ
jgi:folate-binding protein YgfZ